MRWGLAVAAVVFAWLGTARADVPPEPNSKEAHCTPAEQCPDGIDCPRAVRSSPSAEPIGESCRDRARAKGYEQRCGWGATFGHDLFCPPGQTGSWKPADATGKSDTSKAKSDDKSGDKPAGEAKHSICSTGAPGSAPRLPAWALFAAIFAAGRRSRGRSGSRRTGRRRTRSAGSAGSP